ncbi:MAG: hypothetical protein RBR71_03475 [Gudongella sp.]|nr:hypothetical protein [Gudongella sp.]
MSKAKGKKIVVKFTEKIVGDVTANKSAFTIKGQQYKYINGPLINGDYQIESIEHHPTIANALLLTMKDLKRFATVEGNLTIEYDASVGTLTGEGGAVESFIEIFTPLDLIPEPNPGIEETLKVAPTELILNLRPIEYVKTIPFNTGTITAAPVVLTVNLRYVGVVNP